MKALSQKLSLLFLPLLLTACGPQPDELSALATMVVGPEYSANKGIHVPDDTRHSLSLKVVDVGEGQLAAHFDFSLRIYAVSGDVVRASGTVTAAQAEALRARQPLQITMRANESMDGMITVLRTEMQQLTGEVEVLVEFPKSDDIEAGSFVTARAALEGANTVAIVPRSALLETIEGCFVYTESGDHFVRTAVKVGTLNANFAEITDGLYSGDRVVAEPAMSLWLTELAAIKGGHACCVIPVKGK